jgi:predicted metalloendopeptidase
MENKVRPNDDFFEFVNHDWLEKTSIPKDKSLVGAFENLRENYE